MRPYAVALVSLVCVGLAPSAPNRAATIPARPSTLVAQQVSLDSAVHSAVDAFLTDAPQAVGLSVAVIHQARVDTYHFGTTQLGRVLPPEDRTIYAIASVTKTVVGSLLAKAAVAGRLALDDDVREFLDGPSPNLERGGQPVRVAHLLNHLSGLPRSFPDHPEMQHTHPSYAGDPIPWAAHVNEVLAEYHEEDFLADLRSASLISTPGTTVSYSNAAAQVAGLILERVYVRPLEVLVDSLIAQPLDMDDTAFMLDASQTPRLALGYDEGGRRMPRDLSARGAAGGLMSSAADLARYVLWHLDESDPAVLLSHTTTAGYPEGEGEGLNWIIQYAESGLRRIVTDGTVPGFSSRLMFFPDLDIGVVVLTNQLDATTQALTHGLANQILAFLDPKSR